MGIDASALMRAPVVMGLVMPIKLVFSKLKRRYRMTSNLVFSNLMMVTEFRRGSEWKILRL